MCGHVVGRVHRDIQPSTLGPTGLGDATETGIRLVGERPCFQRTRVLGTWSPEPARNWYWANLALFGSVMTVSFWRTRRMPS